MWKKLKRCPEPETLGRVIAAVAKAVAKDVEEQSDKQTSELVGTLSFIPTVPEFDMACMMLTENDQQGEWKLLCLVPLVNLELFYNHRIEENHCHGGAAWRRFTIPKCVFEEKLEFVV